jgi:hypothetical protein
VGREPTRKLRARSRPRLSTNQVGGFTNEIGMSGWNELFASRTLVALLTRFLMRPDERLYQQELAEAVGARLYLVQRELARLERVGLLTKTPRGNRVYYQANRSHPAFEDLKRVFLKTIALGDALRAALAPLADRVRVALVSMAPMPVDRRRPEAMLTCSWSGTYPLAKPQPFSGRRAETWVGS